MSDNNFSAYLNSILSTPSIKYKVNNKYIHVLADPLINLGPLPPNCIARLYVEGVSNGSFRSIKLIGLISAGHIQMFDKSMFNAGSFQVEGNVFTVWINSKYKNRVRVILPPLTNKDKSESKSKWKTIDKRKLD